MTGNRATLRISFTDRNEVQSIRFGDVAFATGGGDLWTAEFAAAGDLSNRIEVRAGEAASFEREEDGAFQVVALGLYTAIVIRVVLAVRRAGQFSTRYLTPPIVTVSPLAGGSTLA